MAQSDRTHLYGVRGPRLKGVDTRKTLDDVVSLILEREEPCLGLLTGDVSQDESPKSYGDASEILLRIVAPVYFIPGNHEDYIGSPSCPKGWS